VPFFAGEALADTFGVLVDAGRTSAYFPSHSLTIFLRRIGDRSRRAGQAYSLMIF